MYFISIIKKLIKWSIKKVEIRKLINTKFEITITKYHGVAIHSVFKYKSAGLPCIQYLYHILILKNLMDELTFICKLFKNASTMVI